ncbi:MAG TPA: hypothetical protein VLG67_04085 [Candidatus Saccharimonadales bacterium]|nr:hypothetical protein [Candidatus Saccharimonadales bacterium]
MNGNAINRIIAKVLEKGVIVVKDLGSGIRVSISLKENSCQLRLVCVVIRKKVKKYWINLKMESNGPLFQVKIFGQKEKGDG